MVMVGLTLCGVPRIFGRQRPPITLRLQVVATCVPSVDCSRFSPPPCTALVIGLVVALRCTVPVRSGCWPRCRSTVVSDVAVPGAAAPATPARQAPCRCFWRISSAVGQALVACVAGTAGAGWFWALTLVMKALIAIKKIGNAGFTGGAVRTARRWPPVPWPQIRRAAHAVFRAGLRVQWFCPVPFRR